MSMSTKGSTVVGVFEEAREAIEALKAGGFNGETKLSSESRRVSDSGLCLGTVPHPRALTGARENPRADEPNCQGGAQECTWVAAGQILGVPHKLRNIARTQMVRQLFHTLRRLVYVSGNGALLLAHADAARSGAGPARQ